MTKAERYEWINTIKSQYKSEVDTFEIVNCLIDVIIDMNRPNTRKPKPVADQTLQWAAFDEWYALYTRKEAVGDAKKAWARLLPTEWPHVIAGLRQQLADSGSQINQPKTPGKRDVRPLPATWLRAERWKDQKGSVKQQKILPACKYCSRTVPKTFITYMGKPLCDLNCKNKLLGYK